ncbi:hypothetical protein, partial [Arthrobacter globiformis]|uniref:hypothetical protein n=1 Tax=Arthrobacter globiformis TaxID=1665 RepID=UPI001124EF6C
MQSIEGWNIGRYGSLSVGSLEISSLRDGISNDLFTVFRDEMISTMNVPASEYEYLDSDEDYIQKWEFKAAGTEVLERLTALGITRRKTLCYLNDSLAGEEERTLRFIYDEPFAQSPEIRKDLENRVAVLRTQTAEGLIRDLADARANGNEKALLESQSLLLDQLEYWDERYALRAVLEACPQDEVTLDITYSLGDVGYDTDDLPSLASSALDA